MQERYTIIQHNIRKHFGLKTEEYEVLDAIYCLSRNQACKAKPQYYIDLFDISERTYFNIIKKLKEKQLIEKYDTGVRSTRVWDEAMAGRLAPWVDPSEKSDQPEPKLSPEKPMDEPPEDEKLAELSVTAEFAVCHECAEVLQNLQSTDFDTAKNAVKDCKKCSEVLQNLQKTTAENAVLNIVINSVINNDNNKAVAPAKAETTFSAINKIFESGSKQHTGTPYYRDAKESRHIKLLEPRFEKDPIKFLNDTRKFYWLITRSGDQFWMSQPFTPSAFNSLYNRVLSYKPSADVIKREERKKISDEDIIIERYGNCSKSDLDYLFRAEMICREDYEMLLKRLSVEAPS